MRGIRRFRERVREWLRALNKVKMSKEEVAVEIENFLGRKGGPYDWDDFMSFEQEDPDLDRVRLKCVDIFEEWMASGYRNEEGFEVLREMVKQLRQGDPA